jgi:hypothetical protein
MGDNLNIKDALQKLGQSVSDFLTTWAVVRICPHQIQAPPPPLSFNVLTAVISLGIFLLARRSVGGSDSQLDIAVVATIVSNLIVFGTGFVTLVIAPGPNAIDRSKKWGTFFVMAWLTSLILLVLFDALPFWLDHTPISSLLVDVIFGHGRLQPFTKDMFRAAFFGVLAMVILLVKSKRMDPQFAIGSRCALGTCAVGLAVNMALMGGFIYGHII